MKKIVCFKTFIYFSLILIFASCSLFDEESNVVLTSSSVTSDIKLKNAQALVDRDIPFASKSTLNALTSTSLLLHWKTARALAVMHLATIREEQNWFGTYLSERPIVIYDAETSEPKYYEFIVINGKGEALGTITTYAFLKGITDGVRNVLPFVRNYASFSAKAGNGTGYEVVDNSYPVVLYGMLSKSGDAVNATIDPETGESQDPIDFFDNMDEYYNKLTPEEQEAMNEMGDTSDFLGEYNRSHAIEQEEMKKESEEFYTILTNIEPILTNVNATDEFLEEAMAGSSKFFYVGFGTRTAAYRHHEVTAFKDPNVRRTIWQGWCGPTAFSMITAGLDRTYKGVDLYNKSSDGYYDLEEEKKKNYKEEEKTRVFSLTPSHSGDTSYFQGLRHILPIIYSESYHPKTGDGGLYYDMARGLKTYEPLSGGVSWPHNYNRGMNRVGGRYKIKYSYFKQDTAQHVVFRDMPGVSVRLGVNKGGYHIRAIIGAKYRVKQAYAFISYVCGIKFRWFRIKLRWCKSTRSLFSYITSKRILVYDNGVDSQHHAYRPYWESLSKESNFFGFTYRVVKKGSYIERPERTKAVIIDEPKRRYTTDGLVIRQLREINELSPSAILSTFYDNNLQNPVIFHVVGDSKEPGFSTFQWDRTYFKSLKRIIIHDRKDEYWGSLVGDYVNVYIYDPITRAYYPIKGMSIKEADYDTTDKSVTLDFNLGEPSYNNGYIVAIAPKDSPTLGHSKNLANLDRLINTTSNMHGKKMKNHLAISELIMLGDSEKEARDITYTGKSSESTTNVVDALFDGKMNTFFKTTDNTHPYNNGEVYKAKLGENYVQIDFEKPRKTEKIRIYDRKKNSDKWGTLVSDEIFINGKRLLTIRESHYRKSGTYPYVEIPVNKTINTIKILGKPGIHRDTKNNLRESEGDTITISELKFE